MAHIHTGIGEHDYTVSFFIIRLDLDEPRLMLHQHRRVNKLMMFGGHVELNETPWAATIREIGEETGYRPEQLRILQPRIVRPQLSEAILHPTPVCHSTGKYPGADPLHYHTDTAYAFVTHEPPTDRPGEDESTDIREVTLQDLLNIKDDHIMAFTREVGLTIFDNYLQGWQPFPLGIFELTSEHPPRRVAG